MAARDIRFATPRAPRHQLVLCAQSLDEIVPEDAPVRSLAALLEEIDWSAWERPYEGIGQPPIHPRYMAGAILLGLLRRVRSTRELETAARLRLDFIWLLEGFRPDHSTFAKFRLLHGEAVRDLHRQIAAMLVDRRQSALLALIVDGTRLRASSDRQGTRRVEATEAVMRELEARIEEMRRNDAGEAAPQSPFLDGIEPPDAADGPAPADPGIARAERKLENLGKARDIGKARDARSREHNGRNAKPVRVPLADPESQVAPNKEGGYAPNYTPVAAVEAETGAIVYADVAGGLRRGWLRAPGGRGRGGAPGPGPRGGPGGRQLRRGRSARGTRRPGYRGVHAHPLGVAGGQPRAAPRPRRGRGGRGAPAPGRRQVRADRLRVRRADRHLPLPRRQRDAARQAGQDGCRRRQHRLPVRRLRRLPLRQGLPRQERDAPDHHPGRARAPARSRRQAHGHRGGQGPLQEAGAGDRGGLRTHQGMHGHPRLHPARPGEGPMRLDLDLRRPQPQEAPRQGGENRPGTARRPPGRPRVPVYGPGSGPRDGHGPLFRHNQPEYPSVVPGPVELFVVLA